MKSLISSLLIIVVAIGAGYFAFGDRNEESTIAETQVLSKGEILGLSYMREEEKLARDVYTKLYEKWGMQIFSNIASSEQTHMDEVLAVLNKYELEDPVKSDQVGAFVDPNLAKLYQELATRGLASIEEALTVGALIEDLDIYDLSRYMDQTENADITRVYENLARGSRNHLRSFASQLKSRGIQYVPKYISLSEYENILSSDKETGSKGFGGRNNF